MKTKKLMLSILPDKFGICHFDKNTPIPSWALEKTNFTSITRTMDELSITLPQEKIPGGVMVERDWRAFKLEGDLDLTSIGVIASLAKPLAEAKISIFDVSTYETNYILVEEKNLAKAKKILRKFCNIKK
ncbi:MAG: ACT domain-containing protein [Candidatus Nealsonbacteria bacterium CG10_big_fil_rev_8_21_14_0_10_36_23]|uniref:ACT domain-containing protein n=1 Tax=Candidatus Nealsonbacteria bacterium CG10_big_fil_rev_8_21_14_0_10_36_23 TaxID=1974709 RepID=A0A2H0TLE3_9BACT|nr:MAG: ACT domain-containing protein [Candidatus Nealsonbacteria bacterium CG10_big_fil_rev_8_21_14_0_10_36_23]